MEDHILFNIIEEYSLSMDKFSVDDLEGELETIQKIVSRYKQLNMFINKTLVNGKVVQAFCLITDMKPGALAMNFHEGGQMDVLIVEHEDTANFLKDAKRVLFPELPNERGV